MASSFGDVKRQPAVLGLPALHTSGSEDGRAAGEGALEALPRLVAQFRVERVYGNFKLAKSGDFNFDAEFLDAGCRPKMRLDGARFRAASGHFKETVAGDLTKLNGFGARADDACGCAFSCCRFVRASTAAARNQAHAGQEDCPGGIHRTVHGAAYTRGRRGPRGRTVDSSVPGRKWVVSQSCVAFPVETEKLR
jgi:hypothetical protein